MKNVFVVHSGSDVNEIKKYIEDDINQLKENANLLVLTGKYKIWKPEALKLLKKANIVFFIIGKHSLDSDNIKWEIKKAIKLNKIIIYYFLNNDYVIWKEEDGVRTYSWKNEEYHKKFDDFFQTKDKFTKENKQYEAIAIEDVNSLYKKIDDYEKRDYNIINQSMESMDTNALLEQYKTYLNTSEALVTRRQGVSNFYMTVNTAIVSIASIIIALGADLTIKLLIILFIALVGIIPCVSWFQILESYGRLNSSKMKVLSIIEKKLPASLFEPEAQIMSDKLHTKKYKSFTNIEKTIPLIFLILYSVIIISSIIVLIVINLM